MHSSANKTALRYAAAALFCAAAAAAGADDASAKRFSFGAELRGRLESSFSTDDDGDADDRLSLTRLRVWTQVEATPVFGLYLEGQAAHAVDLNGASRHTLDVRQAYARLGKAEGRWEGRLGRQELAFGDERLVAADSYWDPLGQVFDAVRIDYHSAVSKVSAFAALVDTSGYGQLTRPSTRNRLYGLYGSLVRGRTATVIEPYLLWKSDRATADGAVLQAHREVFTYGLRTAGPLLPALDYNVETALQGGRESNRPIRAWAGHWEIGVRPLGPRSGTRASAEYNFASGERRHNGRHATFDDLYPAGYNKYGLADPFAWRNLRSIGAGVDRPLTARWRIAAGYRRFWLANVEDRLYIKGEECVHVEPGATSDSVGAQFSAMANWRISKRTALYFGYARFFPGPYLRNSTFRDEFGTPYIMLSRRFE